ncbi:MAG: agmatinase family protein [Planctomycetota bacterium]|jgi:agmatinase
MQAFDPNAAARPDSGIYGLGMDEGEAELILLPIPFDATSSYGVGASRAPAAILEASQQVDLFDRQFGRVYERGIHMGEIPGEISKVSSEARILVERCRSAGEVDGPSIEAIDAAGESVNRHLHAEVCRLRKAGKLVGVIGGDHSVPFGAIQALAEEHPEVGILHIDAHMDLRRAYEGFRWSHASIMDNVLREIPGVQRIVQLGIRDFCEEEQVAQLEAGDRLRCFYDLDLRRRMAGGENFLSVLSEIIAALPDKVYVSLDIDGMDPSLAPHTGTPVPGGLSFNELCMILEGIAASERRIVGFDLNEVSPGEAGDSWDANVGARVLYKLCGFTLLTN